MTQSLPWGYNYTRIRSNGSINYDSFNGDIEFNINNPESERWKFVFKYSPLNCVFKRMKPD